MNNFQHPNKMHIELNDYLMAQLKKFFISRVTRIDLMGPARKGEEYAKTISHLQTYLDEVYRVSKNKAVCYRALIQNMYL